jgi:glycolate oxidase FAD binding subunit
VRAAIPRAETIADLRTGDVVVRVEGARAQQARELLGRAVVLSAGPAAQIDAWGAPPSTLATMRALKEGFDPRGTLAPGRFVGGL